MLCEWRRKSSSCFVKAKSSLVETVELFSHSYIPLPDRYHENVLYCSQYTSSVVCLVSGRSSRANRQGKWRGNKLCIFLHFITVFFSPRRDSRVRDLLKQKVVTSLNSSKHVNGRTDHVGWHTLTK